MFFSFCLKCMNLYSNQTINTEVAALPLRLRSGLDSPDLCSCGHQWQPRLWPPLCLTCQALATLFILLPTVGIADPQGLPRLVVPFKVISMFLQHSS